VSIYIKLFHPDNVLLFIEYSVVVVVFAVVVVVDAHFSSTVGSRLLTGIRLLRQDPVETLLAFICSSNNNISRISGMVQRMCAEFGHAISEVYGLDTYIFYTS